jgi:5-methyltetrahydropteroyltriglutamate--homocysteine methyltransferase
MKASSYAGSGPLTHTLGYPRIGADRELKHATEAYWHGDLAADELLAVGAKLRAANWATQRDAGIDLVAVNDFSFYDQVLDTTCLVGAVPPRFAWDGSTIGLDLRFQIARGVRPAAVKPADEAEAADHSDQVDCQTGQAGTFASEMTKWFDTNYHYLVPELHPAMRFRLSSTKPFDELAEAQALGHRAKVVLVGPLTWLLLGKVHADAPRGYERLALLDPLLEVYAEVLARLAAQGAEWVQLDEPALGLDLTEAQRDAYLRAYGRLWAALSGTRTRLLVATYFGELRDNLATFLALPADALHIDAVRGAREAEAVIARFPADKILSLGVVDGRNVWKNDYAASLRLLGVARGVLRDARLMIAPSCSLQHVPVSLRRETALKPAELRDWLAFAEEKLAEVATLRAVVSGESRQSKLAANQAAHAARRASPLIHRAAVQTRLAAVRTADHERTSPFAERQARQRAKLRLPAFPTTTIGSFPQTPEVRAARAKWKKGALGDADYEAFIEREIAECVRFQDEIGLDMPVHGEFERNDMVEYFGEQLDGFAFTRFGWVQSYGSRYVKPPLIYGDVARPAPMTVRWSRYAQSVTARPMKGMLTGPVTMLKWSFVRDDQPWAATARQIALALRDEVTDLEAAGIAAIQIDEPAFREALPLRADDQADYLRWAVDAFRLSAAGVRDDTQIHTHMCYSEFNDIIGSIAELDADVITIETSRSNMELLEAFVEFKYPNEIGPGVYDIHSPRVPPVEEMENLMVKALAVLPADSLWVNPDCGLKTRGWAEVKPSLTRMVESARRLRARVAAPVTVIRSAG